MMNEGVKYDGGKPRWGLLPYESVEDVVRVLTFGSKKYADDNWKKVPNAKERYFDAMMRHITQYRMGEQTDSETGLSHLAHATCCALFIQWFDKQDSDRETYMQELTDIYQKMAKDMTYFSLEGAESVQKELDFSPDTTYNTLKINGETINPQSVTWS